MKTTHAATVIAYMAGHNAECSDEQWNFAVDILGWDRAVHLYLSGVEQKHLKMEIEKNMCICAPVDFA